MEEIWKDVKDYEGLYEVSNAGNVRSLKRHGTLGKVMCPLDNGKGYLRIKLSKNDIAKRVMLHRIIAIAFVDNPENKKCVNHKDGNKKNNSICNLEWCSQKENVRHAIKNGIFRNNAKQPPNSKKVKNIVTGEIFASIAEASKAYQTDRSYLSEKLRGIHKNNTNMILI